ncbi:carboxypeptidase-like regulatory domain-containing protein [Natrarchaeobius halalkaliphilus]|nr:carboxypeptidase-like regulatory domain-containing protein [Natrarchaeobius halalkaliphilus]
MTYNRRTILNRTALAGLSLFGVAGSAPTAAAEPDDTLVEGTITDFDDPVAEATVSLGDATTTTDEDGEYELTVDPADSDGTDRSAVSVSGERVLEVRADGYAERTRRLEIDPGEAVSADVPLYREWGDETGELQVYATEVDGGSTIPCHVTIYGDDTYEASAPEGAIPDSGSWNTGFAVSEGWWDVRVTDAAGYADGTQTVYVDADGSEIAWVQLESGDREIPGTGRVLGRVVDERGDELDEASVRIAGEPVSVDDDGSFEIDLEHGRHPVTATARGYESLRGGVDARFGRTTELIVPLESQ